MSPQDARLWYAINFLAMAEAKEEPEPTGKEKVRALCDLAVIFGMSSEEAEQATFTELLDYLHPYMAEE
jgi:hypothetical protein